MGKRARRERREQEKQGVTPERAGQRNAAGGAGAPGRSGGAGRAGPYRGGGRTVDDMRREFEALAGGSLGTAGEAGAGASRGSASGRRPDDVIRSLDRLARQPFAKADKTLVGQQVGQAFRSLERAARLPVDASLRSSLATHVGNMLENYWLPLDVTSYVRVKLDGEHEAVVAAAVVAASARFRLERAPEEWREQLDQVSELAGAVNVGRDAAGADVRPPPPSAAQWTVLVLLRQFLMGVPMLDQILDRPSRWTRPAGGCEGAPKSTITSDHVERVARKRGLDPKLLEKVRALLAKAEATTFEAEADAFTAKAQEMMTKHGIEAALLEADDADAVPVQRRVWIDNPYADAKGLLLAAVARANRCRTVHFTGVDCQAVMGFPADLDAVEVLFTSLLVQGATFVMAQGAQRDRYGRSSTTSFRKSFWVSYGSRIGERLKESAAVTVAEADAEYGGTLLPVLASRQAQVEDSFAKAFPRLEKKHYSATNAAGWEAGKLAADQADLAAAQARIARQS